MWDTGIMDGTIAAGVKFEVDGSFMSGEYSMQIFKAGLEGILGGRLPDPEEPEKAMMREHTSATDSNIWFNGTKMHLLSSNEIHATTPFIEWFFVEGSKTCSEIECKQFTYAEAKNSGGTEYEWWPLISRGTHLRGVILPKRDDNEYLSQWPMEAEQEALEAAATDVQRMPTTKDALKHKYQKRFGLSASKDLFVKDCELLGACLYTGPMVRIEVVSSNQSDFTPAPLMHA